MEALLQIQRLHVTSHPFFKATLQGGVARSREDAGVGEVRAFAELEAVENSSQEAGT